MSLEKHYSVNELAALFGTSADFWRKLVSRGDVKAVRLGRCIRIPESEVHRIMSPVQSVSEFVNDLLVSDFERAHL